ncbi:MAG: hypothetical protein JWN63_1933 [Candidatus Acidoferrum typicum]|nr:hypothetical protein [Candidatus Acidoferrum typicum]
MTKEDAKCFRWITSFQACLQILCLRGSNGLPQVRVMTKEKSASSPKKSAGAMPAKGLAGVFAALEEILEPYEKLLHVLPYKPKFYRLVTRLSVHKGKPVWFPAIRMGKNYVSYQLMPVSMNPVLK